MINPHQEKQERIPLPPPIALGEDSSPTFERIIMAFHLMVLSNRIWEPLENMMALGENAEVSLVHEE